MRRPRMRPKQLLRQSEALAAFLGANCHANFGRLRLMVWTGLSAELRAAIVALVALIGLSTTALAHELPRDEVATVGFSPRVGGQAPMDATFVDESGLRVTLGQYFGAKPVLLSLNYFHCQYVCPIEEDGLINALNGVHLALGQDFTLLTVSIDPTDGPLDAITVKARALRGYDRPEGANGWHLLTADATTIQQLTSWVGFQYVPDPQQGDFAHPIGVVSLTPGGRISHYLKGLDFSANELDLALADVSQDSQAAPVVCYQYDPLTGRYTPLALDLVRVGGGAGVAALLGWLAMLWRADLRGKRA
ncbi:MAG: SCO family protein [Chloroflexi bacterium]|nr:SCO family protein [Chloroflexota bacterium]